MAMASLKVPHAPCLLSSRVAIAPSQFVRFGRKNEVQQHQQKRCVRVVAMAKKGKKGGGSVVQKERAPSNSEGGGAKESAYANETRKIILSVHKLKKVAEFVAFSMVL